MNTWQVLQTFCYALKEATWPDGAGEPVWHFGSVRNTSAILAESLADLTAPLAFVYPTTHTADPEIPGYGVQGIGVRLTTIAEDVYGETSLVGGNRDGGAGSSSGRGMLELEEVLGLTVERLNSRNGFALTGGFTGAPAPIYQPDVGYVISREYAFETPVTRARYYHAPTCLQITAPGGGQAVLTWGTPEPRYDFHPTTAWEAARGALILRRLAGPVAPPSPAAGSPVALGSPFAETVTDAPGAGTFTYAIWAGYDETGAGGLERFSDQEPATYRTIVVT